MSIFAHEVPKVALVPIGNPPETVLQHVRGVLGRELDLTVTVFEPQSVPDGQRDTHPEAGELLGRTADPVTDDFDMALGVTDSRFHIAGETDFFGVVNTEGNLAVLSIADALDGTPLSDEEQARLEKLALHSLGQILGFRSHDRCVMQSADTVSDLDDRPEAFCDDCASRLRDPDTAPEPPEWHVVTQELEEFNTAKRWAEGDIRLTEYPILALGWFVNTLSGVRKKIPGASRDVRGLVHESYRTVRFWVLVLTYFLVFAVVAGVGLRGYEAVFGSEPSGVVSWALVVVGLPTAYVVHDLLRAIVGGLVFGVAEGTREGLRAEE